MFNADVAKLENKGVTVLTLRLPMDWLLTYLYENSEKLVDMKFVIGEPHSPFVTDYSSAIALLHKIDHNHITFWLAALPR